MCVNLDLLLDGEDDHLCGGGRVRHVECNKSGFLDKRRVTTRSEFERLPARLAKIPSSSYVQTF